MRYIIIGGIGIVFTVLISKLYLAISLTHFNKYPKEKKETIDTKTKILQTGKNLYMTYCTSCHGKDGKGNNEVAHNHTKRISKESVLYAIKNGANNFTTIYPSGMPSNIIDKDKIDAVATYVASGLKGEKPLVWDKCVACHGEDGEAIAFIAPNIKSYTDELVTTILLNGKKGAIGTMPSFQDRFTQAQINAIALYIRSLGK